MATRGNTNASKRRGENQRAMREKISVTKNLKNLSDIDAKLQSPDLDGIAVSALRARADIAFKLLNKVLPDLRAVEYTNAVPTSVEQMTDAELVAVLRACDESFGETVQ